MKYLIALSFFFAISTQAAGLGYGPLPAKFLIHCKGGSSGHFTLDTITGHLSFLPVLEKDHVTPMEFIRLRSAYPANGFSPPRTVEYISYDRIKNKPYDGGHVEYLSTWDGADYTIGDQGKAGCSYVENDGKAIGIVCQLEDVSWKFKYGYRVLQRARLVWPFAGSEQAVKDIMGANYSEAMIINDGPSVITFDPRIEWSLPLAVNADGDMVSTDASCTAISP